MVDAGLNDCAIARRTAAARAQPCATGERRSGGNRGNRFRASRCIDRRSVLVLSARVRLTHLTALPDSYAYLLGLYLGDGCLSEHRRGVLRLRISLDERYPGIISECVAAMRDVLPDNRAARPADSRGQRAVEVSIYSKQLRCLFPQHAPGRKHERRIALADWQQDIVTRRPDLLIRGLIHSDGCRFTNTVRHGEKTYTYPRYNFSNRSDDIKRIFCDACDLLGIEWRVMNSLEHLGRSARVGCSTRRVRRAEGLGFSG